MSRCFALADVSGPANLTAAVTPACLSLIGRSLVRAGEVVMVIDVDARGAVRLHPVSYWDVQGDVDPETWRYRCNLPAPSSTVTRMIDSPLESATLAGKLSAETAAALGDEASMPRGALLPLPMDGEDPTLTALKADLRTLAGQIATVESVRSMHAGAAANAPAGDWETKRIGADPPAALVKLHDSAASRGPGRVRRSRVAVHVGQLGRAARGVPQVRAQHDPSARGARLG